MNYIHINGGTYILADDLKVANPDLFKGCRSSRNLLKRKRPDGEDLIPATKFLYATMRKGSWVLSSAEGSTRAKLLLERTWVDDVLSAQLDDQVTTTAPSADNVYEFVPDILSLNDAEKFRDSDGNVIDIETRGERKVNGVYFLVRDVSRMLGTGDALKRILLNPDGSYRRGKMEDYVTMAVKLIDRPPGRKLAMFLTYKGLIRVLNVSQSPTARSFRDWAARILQTVQMGDDNDRAELAGRIIGVDIKVVQSVLGRCPAPASTVYLVSLGTVASLRESLGIINTNVADDAIVVKWGRTGDFSDRLRKHGKDLGAVRGAELGVLKYIMIDPVQSSECETDIKNHFIGQGWVLESNGTEILRNGEGRRPGRRTEIAIVPKTELKQVEKKYESLQRVYGGQFRDIMDKMTRLEEKLTHQKERYEDKLSHQSYKLETTTALYEHKLQAVQSDKDHALEKIGLLQEMSRLRVCTLEQRIALLAAG